MSENTVILHISDLHFSSQPEKQREKQYIIEDLIETLSKLDEQWKPQIVCIFGDIVDKCDVEAYPIVKEQLSHLASKLNIANDHFLFTPGNHDCSRDIMVCPNLENITDDQADKYLNLEIPSYLRNRFEGKIKNSKTIGELDGCADQYAIWSNILGITTDEVMKIYAQNLHDL